MTAYFTNCFIAAKISATTAMATNNQTNPDMSKPRHPQRAGA